jgi:hypothetical protein
MLPTFEATRYLVPLREGGSLPAVVDTDGGGLWVAKFRGAGQGAKALIAEIIAGLLANALGLPMPEMALIELAPDFARTEPDPEIQDILAGSRGVNFGIRYLDGALNFDAEAARDLVSERLASELVWLDALLTNPDRTHRNPNILVWEERLWLIDHGAALYAHHNWSRVTGERTRTPFAPIESHVLLEQAAALEDADARLGERIDEATLDRVLGAVPEALLLDEVTGSEFGSAEEARARYRSYLWDRLAPPRPFLSEAVAARSRLLASPPQPLQSRR